MAESKIKKPFQSPVALTITRTENTLVAQAEMNRLHAYKKGDILFLNGNIATSVTHNALSDFIEIGRISGWNAIDDSLQCVPGQMVPGSTLVFVVSRGGVITVYIGQQAVSDWYRLSVCIPTNV